MPVSTVFYVISDGGGRLAPLFVLGRCTEHEGKVLLPLALRVHHAAAGGFRSARLGHELRELVAEPARPA
ncbi:CatA-like O-acetyltransferase [Streptomyces rochei]|uniref:CatA-like O-acetyltransferase n=1 Tax=Streptomyces rochei TaxID=1928 RepID=UPI00382BF6A0